MGCRIRRLFAGIVGELVNQVLVGVAKHVAGALTIRGEVGVPQVEVVEVIQQAADDALTVAGTAQLGLVVPVGAGEDAVDAASVGVFNLVAGYVQGLTEVHGRLDDLAPVGGFGHRELVLVGIGHGGRSGHAGGDSVRHLLVETVGQPLQKQHRENVAFVVRRVDLST